MTEDEYLKLFQKVQKDNPQENLNKPNNPYGQPIRETQNNKWGPSLNETPDVSKYKMNENLNDGWNLDLQF